MNAKGQEDLSTANPILEIKKMNQQTDGFAPQSASLIIFPVVAFQYFVI